MLFPHFRSAWLTIFPALTTAAILRRQSKSFATDAEMFARHARRKKIGAEDVLMLARKTPSLHAHLSSLKKWFLSALLAEVVGQLLDRLNADGRQHLARVRGNNQHCVGSDHDQAAFVRFQLEAQARPVRFAWNLGQTYPCSHHNHHQSTALRTKQSFHCIPSEGFTFVTSR